MKRMALAFGATLALLGACAPYGASDGYYGRGGYYGPDYYGPTIYAQPYGAYDGGYRDGGRSYRGPDRDRGRDHDRGDRQTYQGNRQDNNRGNWTRENNQPAPQTNAQAGSGYDGGNTLPNGDRITRGNFWQLNQAQQNTASQPSTAQPSGDAGGGRMGRHRTD